MLYNTDNTVNIRQLLDVPFGVKNVLYKLWGANAPQGFYYIARNCACLVSCAYGRTHVGRVSVT